MIVSAPWAGAIAASGPSFLPGPLPALPAPIAIWEVGKNTAVVGGGVESIAVTAGYTSNALYAATPLLRPAYSATDGHGGKPTAKFNLSHQLFVPALELPVGCADIAVVLVCSVHLLGQYSYIRHVNTVGEFRILYGNGFQADMTGNVGRSVQRRFLNPPLDQWMRVGATFYKSEPTRETAMYVNNVIGTSNSSQNANNTDGFVSGQPFYVGNGGLSTTPLMDVTEIHIYPKLTAAQLTTLDNYITSKYPAFP